MWPPAGHSKLLQLETPPGGIVDDEGIEKFVGIEITHRENRTVRGTRTPVSLRVPFPSLRLVELIRTGWRLLKPTQDANRRPDSGGP